MLEQPVHIAALLTAILGVRLLVGVWKKCPQRAYLIENFNFLFFSLIVVLLVVRPFIAEAYYIPSGSMEPTLHEPNAVTDRPGDRIIANKFIYRFSQPKRGDIIVFIAPEAAFYDNFGQPTEKHARFVKRVIALPGEEVEIKAGDGVYINGKRLDEPYVSELPDYNWPPKSSSIFDGLPYLWPKGKQGMPYRVPAGRVFALGDNRNNSKDSHLWRNPATCTAEPALPLDRVLGRSTIIFWPPNRFATLTR